MLGWILSGGGARGAYEAGVLRYICDVLGPRLGQSVFPKVICGTSIGALTGTWLGAWGEAGAAGLSAIWQRMEPNHVFRLNTLDLARAPLKLLRNQVPLGEKLSLLDPTPVYELVKNTLPWDQLYARMERGDLRSLVVAATEVSNGRCTLFADGVVPRPKTTATSRFHPTRVRAEHVLASAAIPFVFPVVEAEGRWYVDGALRQNTPLSPAIELGVSRALVVGCKPADESEQHPPVHAEPTPAFLAGKALSAMLLDPVEEDIRRLEAFNRILAWGERAYPDFNQRLAAELRPYRQIRTVYVRPSENVATMAGEAFLKCVDSLPWPTRTLLSAVHSQEGDQEADLMSTLLFHRAYTGPLEELGYADARRQEEALVGLITRPAAG